MSNPIFDIDNGDFLFGASGNTAFDSDGNMMLRISDNMAIDMNSGEIHIVSSWSNDEEDD